MTREEIEQIIKQNIRTNGRGEITAKVMAGVLASFVEYTDGLSAEFVALCNALADAFTAQVGELETKFEGKADALEAAFENFVNDLLNNHFEPWAEALANDLKALMRETKAAADGAKDAIDTAADGIAEALDIIREGNQSSPALLISEGLGVRDIATVVEAIQNTSGSMFLHSAEYALAVADQTEYHLNGVTYVGVIAYAAARGWKIAEVEIVRN